MDNSALTQWRTHKSFARTPKEMRECKAFFDMVRLHENAYPELKALIHIPNEGKRTSRFGAMLRSIGMRKGAPDYVLFVSKHGYHCLMLEMKAEKGRQTKDQKEFQEIAVENGNLYVIPFGWVIAWNYVVDYLGLPARLKV